MAEILTSDLVYGNDAEFDNGVMVKEPSKALRGEPLPKGYEGPPSVEELREMGVLVDEQVLARRGGFEPQGGVKLPENLGQSLSSLNLRQAELRRLAEENDDNQTELTELSNSGQALDLDEGDSLDKKAAEDAIALSANRPEAQASHKAALAAAEAEKPAAKKSESKSGSSDN